MSNLKRTELLCGGDDVDFALLADELDSSVAKSKKGEVTTATDIVAGTEAGSALTDDD